MTFVSQSDRIRSGESGPRLLPRMIELAMTNDEPGRFWAAAIELIHSQSRAHATCVVRGIKGQWRTLARLGDPTELPREMLAETLDADRCQTNNGWIAAPLVHPNLLGQLLVQNNADSVTETEFQSTAAALGLASQSLRMRTAEARRAERLEAMLEMTAHWNQSRQTDQLLVEIAEASTRLLSAERATIFLPDPTGSQLIGKPALGVEEGELRIAATAGVVGQVMQSGKSHRVDADISTEQQQINREVDQQLGFQTRTLLCVPLVNSNGKTIGAFELINKLEGNFSDEDEAALIELAAHSAVAIENTQHVEHLVSTRRQVADQAAGQIHLIGQCSKIESLQSDIERVADTELAILITGENGTGKEVVAQLVHYMSNRRDHVLVAVNCAAISETLLESELFGHEKGAFTDAHQARQGKFELADGGTLFLDEIGDMSLGGQAKLLRVLEEKIVVRVGGSMPIPTTARIVAATNQDLAQLVRDKKFREDLFFRLNVVTIDLPPLRERGDDVVLLAEYFLDEFCSKARRETPKLLAAAKKKLLGHRWPGNVRELRNMMERLAYLSTGDKVDVGDLAFVDSPRAEENTIPMDLPLSEATKHFQCDYIQRHIDRSNGNMTDAASQLGLHRSNLYRKMRQLGMSGADDDSEQAAED